MVKHVQLPYAILARSVHVIMPLVNKQITYIINVLNYMLVIVYLKRSNMQLLRQKNNIVSEM